MKYYLMALLMVIAATISYGEADFLWAKRAGGTDNEHGRAIAVDSFGNTYLTGYFMGTASFGTTGLVSAGQYDVYIAKLDGDGNFLWAKRAGGTSLDLAFGITADAAGNIYVTGYFMGTAAFGATNLVSAGGADIFVTKLDTYGNFVWTIRAGGTDADVAYSTAVDASGEIYISGYFMGTAAFGATNLASAGNSDILVAKLDGNGNFLWAKQAGGTGNDLGEDIAVDAAGISYITGKFRSTASFDTIDLVSAGNDDIFIAKLDGDGDFLWAKRAGGTGADIGESIAVDAADNAYVTGDFRGTAAFGATNLVSAGEEDVFVTRLDGDGNFLWAKRAGGSSEDIAYGIAIPPLGTAVVTGNFRTTADFGATNLVSVDSADIFVTELDGDGNFLWAKRAGGTDWEYGYGIAVDALGNAYLTGSFWATATFGSINLISIGALDVYVTKLKFISVLNAPVLVAPANAALDQPIDVTLQWQDTNSAKGEEYGYRVRWRVQGAGSYTTQDLPTGSTSYSPGPLDYYTTYEWNVRALGDGTTSLNSDWANGGTNWTFRTQGETLDEPALLSPANGAVDQGLSALLQWQDTNGAKGQEANYQVRWRTMGASSYNTQNLPAGSTSFSPGPLDYYTTYQWNVRALGNGTSTLDSAWANSGTDWTFRTTGEDLNPPVLQLPANGAIDEPVPVTLQWQDTNDPAKGQETYHQVRWREQGTGSYNVRELVPGVTTFQPPDLDYITCYEWNVRALGNGLSTLDSDWAASSADWTFTTVCSDITADAGTDTCIGCGETTVSIGGSPTASGGMGPYTYVWSPGTGLDNRYVANPQASPTTDTLYTVQVTDAYGCTNSDSVQVAIAQTLSAPTISCPANGAVDVPVTPDITWSQVAGNAGYRLYLDGPDLPATEVDVPQDITLYQVPQGTFSYGCTYSLKVKTLGNGTTTCTSAYGTLHTFIIATIPTAHVLPFAYAGDKGDFRANVGLLELPSANLVAGITCLSSTGYSLAQQDYQVNAWTYLPIADITSTLGVSQDASLDIDADGPFLSIGGIIDNTTDDPSVSGSELARFTQGFTPLVLKTADWNTQIVMRNMSGDMAPVTLSAYPISGGTTPSLQKTVIINANGFFATDDIITFLGGSSNDVFLLKIDANQSLCGYARQYTSTHTGGIYPFYAHGQGASTLVFPYLEDTDQYRSNIGITRTQAGSASVTLKYYSGGSLQASRSTGVAQNQYIPIINAIRWIRNSSSSDPLDEHGYVVIESDNPIYAIGGPTDNTSNDPSVQGAAYTAFADTIAPIVLKSGPWSTRVVLTNHSASSVDVTIQLVYEGSVADSSSTSISAYDQLIYDDVIDDLFPTYVYGTLRIVAADPIYVYVHQYTNANTGGIYPVFNTADYD